MEGCPGCEMVEKGNVHNLIMENQYAMAIAIDAFREGHCLVYLKRHIQTISAIDSNEYSSIFELITKVSKALEKKYSARKTYLLAIGDGDKFQHLHFHLIPKHRHLPSMGVYCFQKLHEAEAPRKPTQSEQQALANEIRGIIESS
jgi:diadenosine tetraphosphate (Ap4A) HIT family hydrolase